MREWHWHGNGTRAAACQLHARQPGSAGPESMPPLRHAIPAMMSHPRATVRTCSMQGVVPQTITWYLPILLRLNMV